MAVKIKSGGGKELNYTANLDIKEASRRALELQKILKEIGITNSKSLDTKGITGYQQAQIALKKTLVASQQETEKLRQENIRLKGEYEKGKISAQEYRTEIARINLARKQEVQAQREARKAAQEVAGSYNEASRKLRDLGIEIRSTGNGMRALSPELKTKIKEYNDLNDALKRFDANMGIHTRNVGNYKGAIRSTAEDLLGFASAYLSVGNALTYVFNQTLAFQRIRTPLTFILGSEGAADAKLKELEQFADKIGVEYFSIANSYKQFTAAAKASNFDLRDSEKVFRSVAKAGAVLGLSNDTLQGTFLALQQMISKGTVQSEELRGQLSERLPGAFALAAKAMGVTEKKLGDLLKAGEVTASEMLPKLAKELDKEYGNKAAGSISGLNAELGRLNSEVQAFAGQGSFLDRNLFQPIVRGAKNAVQGLRELVRGDGVMDFLKNATTFTGKEFRNRQDLYDLRDFTKNTNSSLVASQNTDYTSKNLKELRNSYQEADIAYKNAVKAMLDFNEKSKNGNAATKEEYKEQLSALKTYAEGYRLERVRIGREIDKSKKEQIAINKEISDADLNSITEIRKRIIQLQKMPGSAILGSEVSKRIQALQDRLKKPNVPMYEAEESEQKTLQKKITDTIEASKRKQLDADKQEVEAVRKKYADLRQEAKDHNAEVDRFNNDIRNRNKQKKVKVNLSGLLEAESTEIDTVTDKVNATNLKTELDKMKNLYAEFENYRDSFGLEKAKARYAKLINVDQTYLEALQDKTSKLIGDDKAKGGDAGGGVYVAEQLKVLKKETEETIKEEQRKNDALLKEFQSYADRRKNAQEVAIAKAAQARKLGDERAAQEAINAGIEEVRVIDEVQIKKMDSYKRVFDFVGVRSKNQLLEAIKAYEADLKAFKGDAEAKAKAQKELDNLKKSLKESNVQDLEQVIYNLERISSLFGDINDNVGSIASTLLNAARSYVEIQKGVQDLKDPEKSTTEKVGAGIGILGAAASIFSSITGYFKGLKAAKEAAWKAMDDFQQNAKKGELEYQALLRKRELDEAERGKNSYKSIIAQLELLKKQSPEIQKAYDRIFASLQGQEYIDSIGYKHGTLLRKAKTWDVMAALAGSDYNRLEALYTQGKLKDQAKADFESLKALRDELEQTGLSVQDLQKQLNELLTGTTVGGLAYGLAQLFENGKFAAQDFAASFEDIMRKSLLTSFNKKVMEDALQPFYDEYAALFASGTPTNDQVEALKKKYQDLGLQLGQQYQDLLDVTGADKFSNQSNQNTLKGNVESLTENTGSKIVGAFNGMRLVQMETLQEAKLQSKSIGDLFLSVRDNAAILMKIERNTKETADNTSSAIPLLKSIAENTKGSLGVQLRAAGKYGY